MPESQSYCYCAPYRQMPMSSQLSVAVPVRRTAVPAQVGQVLRPVHTRPFSVVLVDWSTSTDSNLFNPRLDQEIFRLRPGDEVILSGLGDRFRKIHRVPWSKVKAVVDKNGRFVVERRYGKRAARFGVVNLAPTVTVTVNMTAESRRSLAQQVDAILPESVRNEEVSSTEEGVPVFSGTYF